jgi:putative colanic acid biosynthesis UDP-glucose lipid carrier transferase
MPQQSMEPKIQKLAVVASFSSPNLRQHIDSKLVFYRGKRFFDIAISLCVSVFILSWLFPLIALMIRLESRGPVLFIQRRVGMGGRTFRCLKFRTMVVNSDANTRQAQLNDRRITRVGQFLRVSNLDEFPQFLNVLMGDMSIVGPRPHMHADCSKFSSLVNGYKFRNMVKPGITGLAQVKGYRGPTKDFASIFHRYQFDAFYVRNANFWLDMRIIRKTAGQTLIALVNKLNGDSQPINFHNRRWVMAIRSFLS